MNSILLNRLLAGISTFGLAMTMGFSHKTIASTCYGNADCHACRNCNYCKNCNSGTNYCGVWYAARGMSITKKSPSSTYKRARSTAKVVTPVAYPQRRYISAPRTSPFSSTFSRSITNAASEPSTSARSNVEMAKELPPLLPQSSGYDGSGVMTKTAPPLQVMKWQLYSNMTPSRCVCAVSFPVILGRIDDLNNMDTCNKWIEWNDQLMHMIYTNLLCESQSQGQLELGIYINRSGQIKLRRMGFSNEAFESKVAHAIRRLEGHPALAFPAESSMESASVYVNIVYGPLLPVACPVDIWGNPLPGRKYQW